MLRNYFLRRINVYLYDINIDILCLHKYKLKFKLLTIFFGRENAIWTVFNT